MSKYQTWAENRTFPVASEPVTTPLTPTPKKAQRTRLPFEVSLGMGRMWVRKGHETEKTWRLSSPTLEKTQGSQRRWDRKAHLQEAEVSTKRVPGGAQ